MSVVRVSILSPDKKLKLIEKQRSLVSMTNNMYKYAYVQVLISPGYNFKSQNNTHGLDV